MSTPAALLFDMDGTLTEPLLDFAAIRAEIGLPKGIGILEAMSKLSAAERERAASILDRHELHAAEQATLNAGCLELLSFIRQRTIPTALITRNSRASLDRVLSAHQLSFDVCIAREDAAHKPDPAPLRLACRQLHINCESSWMIGDGEYDIAAGAAAGCRTVWLSHGRQRRFQIEPWQTVIDLPDLHNLLRRHVS